MSKSYIDGKIFLLFPKNKNIAIYQDETNQKELNQQRKDNLKRLSKEDKNISPHTIEIYRKSLREIIIEESFEDMNEYIHSILNKTFPRDNIKEAINDYSNKEFEWKYIFGDRDYSFSLNGYSLNFVPCDYNWETNKKDKELQFNVKSENWKINEHYILITIEFKENFSVYSHEMNNCMNWKHFAHRLYYSIEYSPFFKEFRLLNESSYIKLKNDEYTLEEKIQRIDFGFYDDLEKIQNKMNNLYEDEIKGDLLKLEETTDLISYDGYGNYCKEVNGRIYKSTINFDRDIPIPEIFEEYFTHIEWFNR